MIRIVNKTGEKADTKVYGFDKKRNMHEIQDVESIKIFKDEGKAEITFTNVQIDMVNIIDAEYNEEGKVEDAKLYDEALDDISKEEFEDNKDLFDAEYEDDYSTDELEPED